MSDKDELLDLEQAVEVLHRGKYRKSAVWNDVFREFKCFEEASANRVTYFRMLETPTDYRYSEDSHLRIAGALSGLLANLEVEKLEHDFEKALFLLRSDCNYLSLQEFLKIKRLNQEHVQLMFALRLMGFLSRLIPVLTAEQILTQLNLSSICLNGEDVRLCDYDLLFYPRNRRSATEGLQQKYIREAGLVIFQVLNGTQPATQEEVYRIQIKELLADLKIREASASGEQFVQLVSDLLIDGVLDANEVKLLTKKVIYQASFLLTESNVTLKDERTESTALGKNLTRHSSLATKMTSIKPIIARKRKLICAAVCFLLLLVAVGCAMFLFVFNDQSCRPNEYYDNHRCYPCHDGCKNCQGQLNNQCTKCWGTLWLVKLNDQQRTGSCEQHCIGQEYEGRECIVIPADSDVVA